MARNNAEKWRKGEPVLIRTADIVAGLLIGFVFIVAALSKALHPAPFVAVVDTLVATSLELPGSLEPRLVLPLSILTIGWEALLGMLVLAGTWRRAAALAVALTLIAFCGVLVRLLMLPETPSCGCFGAFPRAVEHARHGVLLGLVRNVALLFPAVWTMRRRTDATVPPRSGTRVAGRAMAFSLLETLVTIAIIALVVAITLPALRHAREQSRYAGSFSAMRQLLASIDLYSSDRDATYPFLGVPGAPDQGLTGCSTTGTAPSYFGGHKVYWPTALARAGHEEIEALAANGEITTARRAEYAVPDLIYTTYLMTHAAAADPDYWEPGVTPLEPSYYRSTVSHEVTFPSAKGLMVDVNEDVFNDDNADSGWSVGLADGSAAFKPREPVVHDDLHRPHGAVPWTVLTTPRGLHGRDW